MKRFTVGLVTLLTGAAITACGSPSTTTPSATSSTGTGSTSATTSATSDSGLESATTEATSTSGMGMATTEATSTSGMGMATTEATSTSGMESATTEATSTSGMGMATTEATSTSGTSATTTSSTGATSAATGNTIVDVAGQQGNFTTLITALQVTGLDKQLSAAGEYTVFAPTDAAFAALPSGTIQTLLANPTLLTQILSYHVAQGSLSAADVSSATSIPTVEGQSITVSASGGTVTLNGDTKVTSTDIQTSNGIIHVIDKVLLPPGVTLPS